MATTRTTLSSWFDRGVAEEREFMIVVCDTFDYVDYPVYADASDVHDVHDAQANKNMTRIMEVYDLRDDKAEQLAARRVHRLPARPS